MNKLLEATITDLRSMANAIKIMKENDPTLDRVTIPQELWWQLHNEWVNDGLNRNFFDALHGVTIYRAKTRHTDHELGINCDAYRMHGREFKRS